MTARPTGPSPMTSAASPLWMPLLATACTPTASGSVSAASRGDRPVGTLIAMSSFTTISSRVAAVVPVREPDAVEAVDVEGDRQRHDDVAGGQVVAPRPELDDLAAELVAHHDVALRDEGHGPERIGWLTVVELGGELELLASVAQQVQVAAADAAGDDLGQYLSWSGDRVGELVDTELPIAHHGGSHPRTLPRVRSAARRLHGLDDELERGVAVDRLEHLGSSAPAAPRAPDRRSGSCPG